MTNNNTDKNASPAAEQPKPKPIGFEWACSNGHKNVREFPVLATDRFPQDAEQRAKRAARNHKVHHHGSRACRQATVKVSPIHGEVGDQ